MGKKSTRSENDIDLKKKKSEVENTSWKKKKLMNNIVRNPWIQTKLRCPRSGPHVPPWSLDVAEATAPTAAGILRGVRRDSGREAGRPSDNRGRAGVVGYCQSRKREHGMGPNFTYKVTLRWCALIPQLLNMSTCCASLR